ncbi:MAG: TolC family protein [Acidiferrobacterales bacterium]
MIAKILLVSLAFAGLAGCATYHPKPLNLEPDLPQSLQNLLTVDPRTLPLPELRAHKFDPSDGLDMTEVAMLAVANNPQLRIARDDAGIAHAQAFAAGLLPDPQLSLTRDFPTNGGPGNTDAFGLGLSYDVGALLVHSAVKGAATATARKLDLVMLWQEWQVVSQARLLFVRIVEQKKVIGLLNEEKTLFAQRLEHIRQALHDGNATLDAESTDLIAVQQVDKQINDAARRINQTSHDLNALLGLAPEVKLDLTGSPALSPLDDEKVTAALPDLARRRPDLLALQAGYDAQEERVRQAVLAQFPAINIGITRARDTSNLYSSGFGVTISLPIFNRNRGAVAVEKATRQGLYDEFHLRLNAAYSEIHRILDDQRLLQQQLDAVTRAIVEISRVVHGANAAYRTGDLDELSYVRLAASLVDKRIESTNLEQDLLEQRVALQTLIGGELSTRVPTSEVK